MAIRKRNPYYPVVISLIDAYAYNKKPNPHEVFLAATYVNLRTTYWGGELPTGPAELVDGNTGGGGGSTKGCCKRGTCDCKGVGSAGARSVNAANPVTQRIETLIQQLKTMPMTQPNAWQDWSEAVAYFYDNIGPFLTYFTYSYKNGDYADFYKEALGVYKHKNGNTKGLSFSNGETFVGVEGTKAVTTITVDTVLQPDDDGKYIIIYETPTLAHVLTIKTVPEHFMFPGHPSLTPPPGVTYNYNFIELRPVDSAVDNTTQFIDAVNNLLSGLKAQPTVSPTVLTIEAGVAGEMPLTDAANFISRPLWDTLFTNGIDATGPLSRFTIDFTFAEPVDLKGRFFILHSVTGESTLFWYTLDGAGTVVEKCSDCPSCNPCVADYDYAIAIDVLPTHSPTKIAEQTEAALLSSGLVNVTNLGTDLDISYIAPGTPQEFDPGNALIGLNYQYYHKLIASDSTELATGITSNEEYAEKWNELRVPYEATLGKTYPYLDPRMLDVGSPVNRATPCGACFRAVGVPVYCPDADGSSNPNIKPTCCRGCSGTSSSAMFRTSRHKTYLIENYNTPGNLYKNVEIPLNTSDLD